ncbi:MAG: magnesium transporter [Caryophanon sp.]|nr:magnesium transporter [Caryophanon sp.]
MSYCTFIASNLKLPEVKGKEAYITVREAMARNIEAHEFLPWEEMDPEAQLLVIENEEDLYELTITADTYYDVSDYTKQPFIYELSFHYTAERVQQLFDYIKAHQQDGQVIELQQVWLDEYDVPTTMIHADELTLAHLQQLYDDAHEQHQPVCCLVIDK